MGFNRTYLNILKTNIGVEMFIFVGLFISTGHFQLFFRMNILSASTIAFFSLYMAGCYYFIYRYKTSKRHKTYMNIISIPLIYLIIQSGFFNKFYYQNSTFCQFLFLLL
ncbi:hypothetical protein MHBO_001643 [Bonamia ostreae]|uniref:Uncharacterized protein n=1 Tax=Bonamia ostreae TaxID=126728 RepID=A0ABV2AJP4_9EUKA